jgi:hypothetical protein
MCVPRETTAAPVVRLLRLLIVRPKRIALLHSRAFSS